MFHDLISTIVDYVSQFGYTGIAALMFLESSFFPFPSEIVMIPAGYLAYQGEMSIEVVIAMGVLGSLLGALFNYYLAVKLGRPFMHKYAKWFFMTEEKLKKVEAFFKEHGEISTFVGRLVPGVRQYISFPAGISLMNLPKFCFFTSLGAGIWVTILAVIGYMVGENQALVAEYTKQWMMYIVIFAGVIGSFYILNSLSKKRGKAHLLVNNQ